MKHAVLFTLSCLLPFLSFGQVPVRGGIVGPATPRTGKRLALVIGNAQYTGFRVLRNPVNDAHAIRDALQKAGFTVTERTDLSRAEYEKTITTWASTLGQADIALFFFAGHGAEINGVNYLIPTDLSPGQLNLSAMKLLTADQILTLMDANRVKTKLLWLDACRDNPIPPTRTMAAPDSVRAFTQMQAPAGTFIGFAASPGRTASDGSGSHGLYTEGILEYLLSPKLTIDQVFNKVNAYVRQQSNGQQVPFKNSSLESDLILVSDLIPKADSLTYPRLVKVSGGTFQMGMAEDQSAHTVSVSTFLMSRYEVTVGQFARFVEATRYVTDAEKKSGTGASDTPATWRYSPEGTLRDSLTFNHPVVHVSWNDAQAYCRWLSGVLGKPVGLPTEAQWEYAAGNGAAHTAYAWGMDDKQGGNLNGNEDPFPTTSPVGHFGLNRLGLADLTGNVWEWCADWYHETYLFSQQHDPVGPPDGEERVLRGGSWSTNLNHAKITTRNSARPSASRNYYGFRIVAQP